MCYKQNNFLKKLTIILTFLFVLFTFACKTKKVPFVARMERTVIVQVCDKFQMSYDGLPCIVYFSDGTEMPYTTSIDGKITIKISMIEIEIEKIVYDFSNYKPRSAELLAKEDFKLAKRVTSNLNSNKITLEGNFSSKTKNLFVLVR